MFHIKSFTFNPVHENTYILYNENGNCIIIDPGCYFDNEKEELLSFISANKLTPKYLLNTHCHLDHVFGNKMIQETFELVLHAHSLEKELLDFAPASGLMYELPFDNYKGEITWLKEGDKIQLDEDELLVLHIPGHSPGSVCFYCEKQKFVIGGDVLFQNSVGRTDLPGGSHEGLIKGIKEKLFTLPDDVKVYSGHGDPTTIGEEKKHNPFLQ